MIGAVYPISSELPGILRRFVSRHPQQCPYRLEELVGRDTHFRIRERAIAIALGGTGRGRGFQCRMK